MRIEHIVFHNFRIYKGENIIAFNHDARNISIVSGKNGFGKTTFLMGLVWGLFGKQMDEVDEFFQKEIADQGGYNKYITNSLNHLAKDENDTRFWVSITFADVSIPELPCETIQIKRGFDIQTSTGDELEIYIDGQRNELVEEHGAEYFIRDFILPKEIAKFFFFDAEKIVSLAEASTTEQMKELSRAYTEVLGLKRYEDLKERLQTMRTELKRNSANDEEQRRFHEIKSRIEYSTNRVDVLEKEKRDIIEEGYDLQKTREDIQKQLILEGKGVTVEELEKLRQEKNSKELQFKELQEEFRDLLELAPFAIAGNLMVQVVEQVDKESQYKKAIYQNENAEQKIDEVLTELREAEREAPFVLQNKVHEFYTENIRKLIKKHFSSGFQAVEEGFKNIHDFDNSKQNLLNSVIDNLRLRYKDVLDRISKTYSTTQIEFQRIRRQLQEAEAQADDEITATRRKRRDQIRHQLIDLKETESNIDQEIGGLGKEIINLKTQQSELEKKIKTTRSLRKKDETITSLIRDLNIFIQKFQEKKKISLEKRISQALKALMHKAMIDNVQVDIVDGSIDIRLLDDRGNIISKQTLSKGEKQLYATAILKSMVEESGIEFPVFIDSPMQKLDVEHAKNIINHFYPSISNQVILLPLLEKELNEKEYELIKPKISNSFLIKNEKAFESHLIQVEPENLFTEFKALV